MAKNGFILFNFLSIILFPAMSILGGASTTQDDRKASIELCSSVLIVQNFLMVNEHDTSMDHIHLDFLIFNDIYILIGN